MKSPTALALRLARLIKAEAHIEVKPLIRRTYAGRSDLARGAFKWWMDKTDANVGEGLGVGSQWTAREVARAKSREYSDNYISGDTVIDLRREEHHDRS
jgi:hypothetical protein